MIYDISVLYTVMCGIPVSAVVCDQNAVMVHVFFCLMFRYDVFICLPTSSGKLCKLYFVIHGSW
jgi:hypothetical protein